MPGPERGRHTQRNSKRPQMYFGENNSLAKGTELSRGKLQKNENQAPKMQPVEKGETPSDRGLLPKAEMERSFKRREDLQEVYGSVFQDLARPVDAGSGIFAMRSQRQKKKKDPCLAAGQQP